MSIELIRDMINFEKLVGEGTGQMMVNGDIILGERSPEIANILNMDGQVIIGSSETIDDKVIVDGKMSFEVLYSSFDENFSINKVSAASSFNHNIQVPDALSHMPCKIETRVEHMNYEQVNSRKIKVNAIINITGMVYDKSTIEAVIDMKAQDVQVLREKIFIDEFVSENSGQTIIKGKFETNDNIINEILKSNVFVHKRDITILDGKVLINACARIKLMHDCTDGEVGVLEQDIPFTFELNMPDMNPDMKCDVSFRIEDIYDEIKEDDSGDKKIVDCEVVIDVNAKAYAKREIENVIDAYSPEQRYEMEKQTVKAISFFGEGAESEAIKERLTLPPEAKPLNKIKNMIVKPIITDTKIVEDKVVVEGIANCCVIYTLSSEEGGITSYEEDIPFKSMIDIHGTKIDMSAEVEVNVCDIGYEAASDKNIDVKMIVHSAAKVYSKDSCDIAKGAIEAELPDSIKNMPSIVIYTIQQKDSLWKIAKKYSTTVDDIITLNNIDNQAMLELGTKLLIPKKLFMK